MNQPHKRFTAVKTTFEHLRRTHDLLLRATKIEANGVRGILIARTDAEQLIVDTRNAMQAMQSLLEHFSEWDTGATARDEVVRGNTTSEELDAIEQVDTAVLDAMTEALEANADTDSSGGDTGSRKGSKKS